MNPAASSNRAVLRSAVAIIGLVLFFYGIILLVYSIYAIWDVYGLGLDDVIDDFWQSGFVFSLIYGANGAVNILFGVYLFSLSGGSQLLRDSSHILTLVLSLLGIYFMWGGIVDFLYLGVYLFRWDFGFSSYTIEAGLSGLVWFVGGLLLVLIPRGARPTPASWS